MNSPILFIVFNRPFHTQQVFEVIRRACPQKLYIAADGPRSGGEEAIKCNDVRSIVSKVDWPCDVHLLFRQENLGCRLAVSSALDWFFKSESEGIILEDDCLPHPDFFPYCEELLDKYRNDERVGLISGTSFADLRRQKLVKDDEDYIFTRYPSIWGWASWRRVWKNYDASLGLWDTFRDDISALTSNIELQKINDRLFDQVKSGKIDTWDYQVSFLLWSTSRLSIAPRINLIENIGFGVDATHTKHINHDEIRRSKMGVDRLSFPLIPPKIMAPNYRYQTWIENFATRSFFVKLFYRAKNYVLK